MKSMFFSKKTLCSSYPHWPGALLTLRSRSFMEQTCWLNWIMQLEHVTLRQLVRQMPRVTVDVSFLAKKYESIKIDFGLLFLKIHFLGQYQQRNETRRLYKNATFCVSDLTILMLALIVLQEFQYSFLYVQYLFIAFLLIG